MYEFKYGDIVKWCDEYFRVVKNFGTSGTVVLVSKDGLWEDETEISNFCWDIYGHKSVLITMQ